MSSHLTFPPGGWWWWGGWLFGGPSGFKGLSFCIFGVFFFLGEIFVFQLPSKTSGNPEKKEVLLEDQDLVWLELRHAHIADVCSCIYILLSLGCLCFVNLFPTDCHIRLANACMTRWQPLCPRTKLPKCNRVQGKASVTFKSCLLFDAEFRKFRRF